MDEKDVPICATTTDDHSYGRLCWDPQSLPMDTIEQPGAGAEACIIRLEFTIGLAHS